MLVLRRKKGQKIRIGLDVTLTVLEVKRDGSVVLGFEAPKYIKIHREEIFEKVRPDRKKVFERQEENAQNKHYPG